ncbi:MAG: ABC transporter ATP-binding protein [Nocardioidaceae bacterium]
MTTPHDVDDSPVIAAREITKRFGPITAVDGVDLTVGRGDVYGLLGPNGAGKTTFMRMLFGLIRPDAGTVDVFGRSVQADGIDALAPVAGFVETPRFYPYLSGRVNLDLLGRLDGDHSRARVDDVLERVDLAGRARSRVGAYSYGMVQRLGVAAALMRQPQLLVLDEPTNGLDPAGIRDMRALVRRLAGSGITVLLSSHNMLEVEEICNRVAIMSSGRIAFDGPITDLRERSVEVHYLLETSANDRAVEVCRAAEDIHDVKYDSHVISFDAHERSVQQLSLALARAGVAITSMTAPTSPLETLFFQLTGSAEDSERSESMTVGSIR